MKVLENQTNNDRGCLNMRGLGELASTKYNETETKASFSFMCIYK